MQENHWVRRASAVIGSTIFLVLAPGTVVGYIPWRITHWQLNAAFSGFGLVCAVGVLLICAGVAVLLESFARFALKGLGTPAPVFPPQHLVVTGFYRFVRNPMYVALLAMVAGQSLLFEDIRLGTYALCLWLAFHLFVCVYEEPALRRTFGAEYKAYCAHVARWIPRLTPWDVSPDQ